MDFSDSFRLVNLGVGALLVLGGILQFFQGTGVHSSFVAVYEILFGLVIALLEFQIPPQVSRYANFMFSFIGRGIFYIFAGTLILEGGFILKTLAGSIIGFVGLAYVVLEFIPSIEPPANMREADAGWGAEQV